MTPAELWFAHARSCLSSGGELPSLGPVVRAEGLAQTVAGLLALEEMDSRLRVEVEAASWGCAVKAEDAGGGGVKGKRSKNAREAKVPTLRRGQREELRSLRARWEAWQEREAEPDKGPYLTPDVVICLHIARPGGVPEMRKVALTAAVEAIVTEADRDAVILAAWEGGMPELVSSIRPDVDGLGRAIRLSGLKKPERKRERFWENVQPSEESPGCLDWAGSRTPRGYGSTIATSVGGRSQWWSAHRLSWVLAGNELPPEGMLMRHKCDRTCCVNPDHLEPGTFADNMRDKEERGRTGRDGWFGAGHPRARLMDSDVLKSRLASRADVDRGEVARVLGVTSQYAKDIWRGRKWAHLPMPGDPGWVAVMMANKLGGMVLVKRIP